MINQPARRAVGALILLPVVQAAQGLQDQPAFRSSVETVQVDVLVTDTEGNPVRDLTHGDFTLLEDGEPQAITTFSFIDLPIHSSADRVSAVKDVEPDVTTNTREGRTYVMLLNSRGHRARLLARRFVEEAVGPDDRMAVIHVRGNMSDAQGFTTSRRLMLEAIDRLDRDEAPDEQPLPSFRIAEEVFQRLGEIDGRRKAVVWIDPPSVFTWNGNPATAARSFAQRDALRAATRNNVALYVVSTAGLTTRLGGGELERQAGLRILAEDTGGDVIVNSNNFSPAFQRFVRDNSTYYLLGYVPKIEHRDGRFHTVTVRVSRPDLVVRARRGYYAPEPEGTEPPAGTSVLSDATKEALRMPLSGGELALDLMATPFKGLSNRGSVLLGAHLRGAGLALGSGERIEIAHEGMNTEGTISPGSFHVFNLDVPWESRAAIAREGVQVLDRLTLPTGRHQVRFAVSQPNGRTGSVVADVEVPDFDEGLAMSGIVLAAHPAVRTLRGDPRLAAILGTEPTVQRRFARDEEVTAFVEVYADPRRWPHDLRVTASLTGAGGGERRPLALSPVPREADRAGYVVRLPLTGIAIGDYVLSFEARAGRRAESRQVLFAVGAD